MKIRSFLSTALLVFTIHAVSANGKPMTNESQKVSMSIHRDPHTVYEYASNPANLPKWASGLSKSELVKEGDVWVADSPMGKVKVKFAPQNSDGILDHDVILPNGETNHNPFRVVKSKEGSEVQFTVMRRKSMSSEQFAKDVASVKKDLETLKKNVESQPVH